MDPRYEKTFSSEDGYGDGNGNGIQFGQGIMPVIQDNVNLNTDPILENTFSIYDPVNEGSSGYQSSIYNQSYRGLKFPHLNNPPVPVVGSIPEDDYLHEDCDFSDAILGYISKVLMEEDIEDRSCMHQESLDLQAAEKPFYDVLGKKYPPSPWPSHSSEGVLTSVDHSRESLDDFPSLAHNTYVGSFSSCSGYSHDASNLQNVGALNVSYASSGSSNNTNYVTDGGLDDLCNENQMMWQFRKGVEEANKFLPSGNSFLVSSNAGGFLPQDNNLGNVEGIISSNSRVRKNSDGDDIAEVEKQERSIKQAAIFPDPTLRSEEMDLIFLSSLGRGKDALNSFRDTLRQETRKDTQKDKEEISLSKGKGRGRGKGKGRGRKQNRKKEVIDLRTLLITCAQAVAADDRMTANELLKEIRQHASPFGDGAQRLAHCFANGLEARLAGTGSQIHKALVSKKTCAADYIKAYHLYIASSPFRKISNFASNRTIREKSENATRIHIVDFGILYGFQWPTLIQRISDRKNGPPRLRITGIDFPQPGFRPAQRIEETGRRLEEYARHFNVPFEYISIAKRWENVKVEDLMLDEGEFLVVNCMYRSKNLLDETVVVDSARNIVLNLIKKINPDIFIHGILNGSYNAPFFLTRFREALFHFSALFDMLETNVPRERAERMLLEREIFGREALNVIACEGWERSERPETYKQWHARNLRGWKGRIIYAISCWRPA
ncbi:scarecrow-like protein 9 isoform X2 [Cynara cardunculus var. scolymus]|uniref:scarecrow-like protein 9 isoform X2 n=1 Tax=Cynara cardunculus var. scolymus TaxID=59895 RepID=UPI000D62E325|nr:scarecrow-like protein 9 isoform X2 [Cynara cardunculus var. scolymus]